MENKSVRQAADNYELKECNPKEGRFCTSGNILLCHDKGCQNPVAIPVEKDFVDYEKVMKEYYDYLKEENNKQEEYCNNLLNKFKQDPEFELMQEYGRLLMIHINDFTSEQRKRYYELEKLLKIKS